MFLLYLLGCWTSIEFDFLSVLVVFCFSIVVVLLLVVQGGTMCLPMPPSWLAICQFLNIFIDYAIIVVPFPPSLHSILPTPSLPHSPL